MSDSTDKMDEAVAAVKEIVKESTGIQFTDDDKLIESKVEDLVQITGLDLEEFRKLAGYTPPRSLIPADSFGIIRHTEETVFTLYGKKVTEEEALAWQRKQVLQPYRIKLPDKQKLGLSRLASWTKTMAADSRSMEEDFKALGLMDSDPLPKQYLTTPGTYLTTLGDTTVSLRDGGAFRAPGKEHVEDVLAQAGMAFQIIVKAKNQDGNKPLTDEQRSVISRLNHAHSDIVFVTEAADPIEVDLSYPEPKRIGFFRSLWMGIVIRFGMAAAATSESTKEFNE